MRNKKETIVVTGGTGFVGSNVIRDLIKLNFHVVTFDRFNIENSKINDLRDKIDFFKLDLRKEGVLKETLKKINPSIIVHLAANTNPNRDPKIIKTLMEDNFNVTLNLYNSSLELKNLRCIITFGSAGEYEQNTTPFIETQKEMPASPYSLSKTCISYLSSYFYRIYKLPILILRPFVVYGDYQTNNQFIPSLIRKCLKNESVNMTKGEQKKDFIYVKDIVDAIIKIIETKKIQSILGEIINLGTGKEIKIKKAALIIKKETNSKSKINFGAIKYRKTENMHFYGSNTKAKSLLNWSPKYSFEQGIKNTVKWYKEYLASNS